MSGFWQEAGTVLATVVSGVVVYILGEILQTVWIEPLQKYKQLKREVSWALSYYANVYTNVMDQAVAPETIKSEYTAVSANLRKLSCDVRSFVETLSWFRLGIPPKKRMVEAAEELMLLSNSLYSPYETAPSSADGFENKQAADRIYSALGVYRKKKLTLRKKAKTR